MDASGHSRRLPAILWVEDDVVLRSMLSAVLGRNGFQVHEASSVLRALEIWNKHKDCIDLLISDVQLHRASDGWELWQQLHREKPISGLLVSGTAQVEIQSESAALGPFRFLPKPFSLCRLLGLIGELLTVREACVG
jgi:DNA-binding NtrC family response regulator